MRLFDFQLTRLFFSAVLRVETVESLHVGSKLLHGSGPEGIAGGDQHAALVLDQPKNIVIGG